MISRRQMLEFLSLSRLPAEFQEVEYLESSGTQYINTGYLLSSNTFETKLKVYTPNMPFNEQDLLSNQDNQTNAFAVGLYRYYVFAYSRKRPNAADNNAISATFSGSAILNIEVEYNGNDTKLLTVNGITTSQSYQEIFNSNQTITLLSGEGGQSNYFIGRFYSCQIYDNSVLVRNFVPCYRKADNVAGLYDLVNGVFYTNAGTGTFIVGGNV